VLPERSSSGELGIGDLRGRYPGNDSNKRGCPSTKKKPLPGGAKNQPTSDGNHPYDVPKGRVGKKKPLDIRKERRRQLKTGWVKEDGGGNLEKRKTVSY